MSSPPVHRHQGVACALWAVDIHRSRSDCGPFPRWLCCGSSK